MPLNTTDTEKVAQAAEELADKVRLERKMSVELRNLFRVMSTDYAALYAQTGTVLDATVYASDLQAILTSQYRRTARKFTGNIIKFLKKNSRNLDEGIIQSLSLIAQSRGIPVKELINNLGDNLTNQLNVFITAKSTADTVRITRTNQKELEISTLKTQRQLSRELDRQPTRREVAAKGSSTFRQRSFNRVGTIAATTTQVAAEGTKQIERDILLGTINDIDSLELGVESIQPKEVWVTQGDNLVRDGPFNHLAADFQEKEGGVFTVSGESLLFPGDSSLGASPGNTINCRCSAVTVIE